MEGAPRGRAPDPGRGECPAQVREPPPPDSAAAEPERGADHHGPSRSHPGRRLRHRPPESERQRPAPFNLMKSETLVWTMGNFDYLEVVTRRERRGSSQGLSVRMARGVYYRPGTFRSRSVEWEETVHQDTGLLGFTTKHLHFSGRRKKFRVRYDRIVDFEPFSDGFGIMRDAQTAKPQSFRTGDGWFAYNLAVNLAQM